MWILITISICLLVLISMKSAYWYHHCVQHNKLLARRRIIPWWNMLIEFKCLFICMWPQESEYINGLNMRIKFVYLWFCHIKLFVGSNTGHWIFKNVLLSELFPISRSHLFELEIPRSSQFLLEWFVTMLRSPQKNHFEMGHRPITMSLKQ